MLNRGLSPIPHVPDSTPIPQKAGTSVKNIERWLKQLKDEKKIEYRGAPKTGGYFPINNAGRSIRQGK